MRITITELKWKENEREKAAGPSIVVVALDKNPPRNGVVYRTLSFSLVRYNSNKKGKTHAASSCSSSSQPEKKKLHLREPKRAELSRSLLLSFPPQEITATCPVAPESELYPSSFFFLFLGNCEGGPSTSCCCFPFSF